MPDHMLGGWCRVPKLDFGDEDRAYIRSTVEQCNETTQSFLTIKRTSSVEFEGDDPEYYHCAFDKVERLTAILWLVHARCDRPQRHRVFTFHKPVDVMHIEVEQDYHK